MKYLGIDYGDSKIGLAIADSETGLALPYKIISNKKETILEELLDIIKNEKIKAIIVGVPFNIDNKVSSQEKKSKQFIEFLKEKFIDIEIIPYDERFSTQAARKLKTGNEDDDIAAMLILQSYLDKID